MKLQALSKSHTSAPNLRTIRHKLKQRHLANVDENIAIAYY